MLGMYQVVCYGWHIHGPVAHPDGQAHLCNNLFFIKHQKHAKELFITVERLVKIFHKDQTIHNRMGNTSIHLYSRGHVLFFILRHKRCFVIHKQKSSSTTFPSFCLAWRPLLTSLKWGSSFLSEKLHCSLSLRLHSIALLRRKRDKIGFRTLCFCQDSILEALNTFKIWDEAMLLGLKLEGELLAIAETMPCFQ